MPMVFNVGIILIILPSLLATDRLQTKGFGLRRVMVYDGWRILYKLQVAVILVHSIIIFWFYSSIFQNGMILDKFLILRTANGATILSYIFGLFFFLLLDKPIRNIDRLVLFPTKISESFLIKRN